MDVKIVDGVIFNDSMKRRILFSRVIIRLSDLKY